MSNNHGFTSWLLSDHVSKYVQCFSHSALWLWEGKPANYNEWYMCLVSQRFFYWWWAAQTTYIGSEVITNCRLYSYISQILLLYKTWRYYNKFVSTKSLGVYYWCVKIPQCGYMEHGLYYVTFYVQKRIADLAMCYNPTLVCDKPPGAPAFEKPVYMTHTRV